MSNIACLIKTDNLAFGHLADIRNNHDKDSKKMNRKTPQKRFSIQNFAVLPQFGLWKPQLAVMAGLHLNIPSPMPTCACGCGL